ncbi:Fic/DOC family N-terminal domain-containing protein [Thermus tengchongensis]|uniref:Fic/DOC N-terminal domain-containing protein n=1 Tax=Thermus tengchongensis TaxID=1214928 RepID=A0A4Y9F790_9DEIN|nr:Fic/DOC family N-terminal domain-containing protein [Thermus tengchongensis]TFU25007.1 hypothetical protein E0687_12960 [Thermus tengchongensis]
MRPEDFSPQAPGRLVDIGGAYVFVPEPLPPSLPWTPRLVGLLDRARGSLGELAGLLRTLPNPYLFIQPFVHKEAVLSCCIQARRLGYVAGVAFPGSPDAPASLPCKPSWVMHSPIWASTALSGENRGPRKSWGSA